jgi:regulator of sirC expression with transglutaminase-like and TPR domain
MKICEELSMASRAEHRERFVAEISQPDEAIDVIRAALFLGLEHEPDADVQVAERALATLAEEAATRIAQHDSVGAAVRQLCQYVHDEQGFAGDATRYYEAQNSFLHRVLERRCGLPITLALIYLHAGRAAGLKVDGISFPAHFLVRVTDEERVIIDPFHGHPLQLEDCRRMLAHALNGRETDLEPYLEPASNGEIVGRMLTNLKGLYLERTDLANALACCERRILLKPSSLADAIDHALVLERMGNARRAVQELERCLGLRPDEATAAGIESKLRALRGRGNLNLH